MWLPIFHNIEDHLVEVKRLFWGMTIHKPSVQQHEKLFEFFT